MQERETRDQQLTNLNALLIKEQQKLQQAGSFASGSDEPLLISREIEKLRMENEQF